MVVFHPVGHVGPVEKPALNVVKSSPPHSTPFPLGSTKATMASEAQLLVPPPVPVNSTSMVPMADMVMADNVNS